MPKVSSSGCALGFPKGALKDTNTPAPCPNSEFNGCRREAGRPWDFLAAAQVILKGNQRLKPCLNKALPLWWGGKATHSEARKIGFSFYIWQSAFPDHQSPHLQNGIMISPLPTPPRRLGTLNSVNAPHMQYHCYRSTS